MIKPIKEKLKLLYNKRIQHSNYKIEKRNIKKKKRLVESVLLDKSQIKAIDDLWIQNYGKKISKDWHRLYTSYMEIFDEKYFPEIFFTANLLDKLNPYYTRKYLEDKILLTNYFSIGELDKDCKVMRNIIYNCNNYFYNGYRNYKL